MHATTQYFNHFVTHTHLCTHTYTHAHACTHTYTHAHACTHTYTHRVVMDPENHGANLLKMKFMYHHVNCSHHSKILLKIHFNSPCLGRMLPTVCNNEERYSFTFAIVFVQVLCFTVTMRAQPFCACAMLTRVSDAVQHTCIRAKRYAICSASHSHTPLSVKLMISCLSTVLLFPTVLQPEFHTMNYREGRAAGNGTRPALTGRRVESR